MSRVRMESLTGVVTLTKELGLPGSQLYSPKISKADLIQEKMRGNHPRYDDLLTGSNIK